MKSFPKLILIFLKVDREIFMRAKMVDALAVAVRPYGSTVVSINRPLCPFSTLFRKPHRLLQLLGRPRLEQLSENHYLFSPRYFLHDRVANYCELLVRRNLVSLQKEFARLSARLGISEPAPLVWLYYPQQKYVTRLFPKGLFVHELCDELADHTGRPLGSGNRLEAELRGTVELFLASSHKLLEKYGRFYRAAWYLGNGLDRETFERLRDPAQPAAPEITRFKPPRIGFTGLLSQRQDWDLVAAIAALRPEWNFIFVGPIYDSRTPQRFRSRPNVHFLGPVEHARMPAILRGFDIGYMPYLDNDFFRYSNPLKFYEFAAAGLRSVSSDMEELRQYPSDFVRVLPNRADLWVTALEELLSLDRGEAGRVGLEIASRFIWEDMTRDLLRRIRDQFYA